MTKAEWLACRSPDEMLSFVRATASLRKLRLYGVACCRRIWELMPDARCELAVEIAASHADGHSDDEAMQAASRNVSSAIGSLALLGESAEYAATAAAFVSSWENLGRTAEAAAVAIAVHQTPSAWARDVDVEKRNENREQAILLREILGDPLRPVTLSPSWRTDTAVTLARQMYDSRDFGAMPILADALQDAGCDSEDILNHCRGDAPHVRGCWVVDLVLDKT